MSIDLSKYPKGILLDIGCRNRKEPHFVGLDSRPSDGVDIVHNIEEFPYPLEPESVLTIKCAHVLEHVKPWLVVPFMDEMWRLLVSGGQLAISAPYAYSMGMMMDPTHCTNVTDVTFQYFDPDYVLFQHYQPLPWKIEHLAWKLDANVEAILRKREEMDSSRHLAQTAIAFGAVQNPVELAGLIEFLKQRKLSTIAEIGTARGGTFYAFCKLAEPDATIVSIDMMGGVGGGGYSPQDQKKFRGYGKTGQSLHFLREDSHLDETKQKLAGILGRKKLDVLFIDGDHTYEGVKKDFEMYSPMVKTGGVIVFHDIVFHPYVPECQVDKFWNEIKGKYNVVECIKDKDTTPWGGIGIIIWPGGDKE